MKIKIIVFTLSAMLILTCIGWLFWQHEMRYALPTPVPLGHVEVGVGEYVGVSDLMEIDRSRYSLLHFFNAECPCSRFNMRDFQRLARVYQDSVQAYVIVQSEDAEAVAEFRDKYELDLPVVWDRAGVISDRCGIYATPQGVVLDKSSRIYYKGNYNQARFCTRKETRYIDKALTKLIAGEQLPLDLFQGMRQAYGCQLPSDLGKKAGYVEQGKRILGLYNERRNARAGY
ncbi:hypothetical protein BFP72_11435 [Reichenbachiella sp. 5M10]|uniref:peroxiredoxin family protein n=1 Tax=Reichenbachiella sp. 5M10 TaxID=1889772 RepID=UPI000C153004|nr:redoxin domain-containing protein [Reichenbachiella sp. 5M10]PIB35963.1 hypothetical protein BFP72_11435 [Reichenbachiella sp. 5M10]